ncbi:amidohydrolase family protein [Pseudoroseomonas ludipueritiae]|uniref:Amidohydrolase family protein n=1 Tax=Pseudoroseomonas ludipueritiae TaxID=198093 RepID=A0ABR7R1L8_9PROT|nr:amidohydrolase family protein [Pseudoroseomonas ludipueritiae]MBC9175625.1 amidohydrolase family protein [Pseudoroseomonas ludipueritiae]
MSTAHPPRIDAHQHYWALSRGDYGWLRPEMVPIHRDFGPSDLDPLLRDAGIVGTIAVQAAPTEAETRYLLDLAAGCGTILGVVGWSDLEAADAPARIRALAADPLLLGLRPMVHDIADEDWLLRPSLGPAVAEMQSQGLVFDALVRPQHLPRLIRFAQAHPGLPVVIDHLAKPDIAAGRGWPGWSAWTRDMAALAAMPQVSCKLSGMVTEAGPGWDLERLRPFASLALELFGPERLLWGSDWPVLRLAGSYQQWWHATAGLLASQPRAARDAVLGGNAARIYLNRRGRRPC